jgi:WD40 repeat protein
VRAWDLASGEGQTLTTMAFMPRLLAIAADPPVLAVADGFEKVAVLSFVDGKELCKVEGRNIVAAEFSTDGKTLFYGSGEELRRVDVVTCENRLLAATGGGWILDLAVSEGWIAYTTKYGKIGIVDTIRGKLSMFAEDAYETKSVAMSPDGRIMAAGSDLKITLWDPARGVRLRELVGHDSPIEWIGFTADGAHVVSRSSDEIRVWRVASDGDREYRGHDARIRHAVISPDGKLIASASADGTVRLWPAVTDKGLPTDPAQLRAWLDETTSVRLDDEDRATSPAVGP